MNKSKWFMIIGTIVLMMAMMIVGCPAEGTDSSESDEETPQPVKHYTVRFDANGGTGTMADLSADVGKEITIPDCTFTAPTGQEFVNWNTLQNGSGTSYSANTKYKDLTTDDGAVVTLFVKWGDIRYTYTFKANGGKWSDGTTADKTVRDIYGADVAKPTDPTKTGYSFIGYDKDVPATFDATNDYFTAQWTANQYTVTLWNDGDVSGDISVDVTYDTIVPNIANLPSKTGYTFGGYYTEANGSGSQYINADGTGSNKWDITENTTLYAYFMERGTHFIYYNNTKEAANLTNPQQFREAEAITLPTITVDGYQFDGWYDSSNDFSDDHHIIGWAAGAKTDNVELWAKWTALQVDYKVKYLFQNTAGNGYDQSGDIVTKTGITDTSTDVSAENNITGFDLQPIVQQAIAGNGSTVVEVKYNRKTITYTFKADDGLFSDNSDETTDIGLYGASVTVPTPTRTGYSFNGWNEADGTIPNTFDTTTDFIAQWTANHYNVTLNNGDGVNNTTIDVTYDTIVPSIVEVPTKTNYTFGGYYSEQSGNGTQYIDADGKGVVNWTTADNGILYAKWTEDPYYTVIFNGNGGTGTMNSQKIYCCESTALTANSFTKGATNEYDFLGWSTNQNTVEIQYADKCSVINLTEQQNGSVTLYAIWSKQNIKIGSTFYPKTSMVQVLSGETTITCDQSSGVFPSARGSVTLGKYAIGKYPVTQGLYNAVMGSNPSNFQNGTALGTSGTISETNYLLRPVEKVSWYDAVVFCNKLSLQMGKTRCYKLKDGTSYPDEAQNISQSNDDNWDNMICDWTANGYRLPTECEWECAARGGTYSTTMPWTYKYSGAGDDDIDKVAWYTSNSSSHTWEVGLKDPNTLGLHDMSGNVWEWCWDNYNESIDSSTPATGPTPSDLSDFRRRRRGGSWDGKASFCAVAYRGNFDPYNRYANNGFRLACSGQ